MENGEQKDNRNGGRGRAKGEERERRAIAQTAGGGEDRAKMGNFLSREITHASLGISVYSLVSFSSYEGRIEAN